MAKANLIYLQEFDASKEESKEDSVSLSSEEEKKEVPKTPEKPVKPKPQT